MKKYLTYLTIAGLSFGCASKSLGQKTSDMPSTDTAATSTTSKVESAVADSDERGMVTELSFNKGKAELSSRARTQLTAVLSKAAQAGKIDDVKVITWADQEYPSRNQTELSSDQRDLVDKRNQAIEDFIKEYRSGTDVDAYNMAERPNALERLLNTDDAKIKRKLEVAGIPTTNTQSPIRGKTSKSIVMAIVE